MQHRRARASECRRRHDGDEPRPQRRPRIRYGVSREQHRLAAGDGDDNHVHNIHDIFVILEICLNLMSSSSSSSSSS